MIELINFNCNNQICKNRSSWMIQFEPPAESVSFWLILSGAAQSNGHSRGEGWEVIDSNLSVHKENISWGDGVCECVGVSLPLSVICEINNLYNGALLKAVIYQVTVSYCSLTCLLSLSHAHTTHYTHTSTDAETLRPSGCLQGTANSIDTTSLFLCLLAVQRRKHLCLSPHL